MHVFANAAGEILGSINGPMPDPMPEGTARILTFDADTNDGLARIVGEQKEWPSIRVLEDEPDKRTITWHGNAIPVQPEGDAARERRETAELLALLFSDDAMSKAETRTLLRMLARRVLMAF